MHIKQMNYVQLLFILLLISNMKQIIFNVYNDSFQFFYKMRFS